MNRKWLVTVLGAALGVSCSSPTDTLTTQLNLDRPVDIAFACYGDMRVTNASPNATRDQPIIKTAQPAASCETRSPQIAPPPDMPLKPPPGQEPIAASDTMPASVVNPPSWYGFILQSASGTVAITTWPSKPSYDPAGANGFGGGDVVVLDADPLTPGKNVISIGEEPIAIATDTSGCYEVTANAGSCDLSVLEITSAVDENSATPVRVERRPVTGRSGKSKPILARPAAMVAQPNTKDVGNECPATANGLVYIAYPSCHMVAAINASSGMIEQGIKYDNNVPRLMTGAELDDPRCPAECPGAGKLDKVTTGARPVALDLQVSSDLKSGTGANTMRLAIGSEDSSLAPVTVVDLDPQTALPLPKAPAQFTLEQQPGVTAVSLSPQIAMGGTKDDPPATPRGGFGQYVYAVATDNTVRVVDVLDINKECDTQVDTRFVRKLTADADIPKLQCFPVGAQATPRRRVGAKGPGIELIGDAVPTSVAIIKGLDGPLTRTDSTGKLDPIQPRITRFTLMGYFAIITASNGRTFVVNVDDDYAPDKFDDKQRLITTPTLVMAHQLRDDLDERGALAERIIQDKDRTTYQPLCKPAFPDVSLGGERAGGPRAAAAPAANATGGPVSTAKVPELPTLHQIECVGFDDGSDKPPITRAISELQFGAPANTRDQVFPDLRSLVSDEIWSLTWEGTLSQDTPITAVDGPVVRAGTMTVDSFGMHLTDQAKPFCTMGVEPFDIVNFRGCNPMNGDFDCPSGYQCFVHPDSKVAIGSCMLKTEASRLANACRDFLISLRHYTIGLETVDRKPGVTSNKLLLLPRKHVLRTTPIDGCTSNDQCRDLANYAVQNANPNVIALRPDDMNLDPHTWECKADNDRADPAQKRCIQTCGFYSDPKKRDDDCGGVRVGDREVNMICQGATLTSRGVCMEGVTPPQACVNGPQRFDVRASEAFTVIGSRSGYIHSIIEKDGLCVTPMASASSPPLQRGRIPLKAPACADPATTNPFTGELQGGGFEANPCSRFVQHAENQPNYKSVTPGTPDTCQLNDPQTRLVQRDAPAIQFRNPGLKLTLVDPYYPGDQVCVEDGKLDGKGVTIDGQTSLHIPLVFPGYSLSFEQKAGFTPLTLPAINPAFPVKVVRGPTDSIWVIDNGDFLSTTSAPSTRGKVFRLESTQLQVINLLE